MRKKTSQQFKTYSFQAAICNTSTWGGFFETIVTPKVNLEFSKALQQKFLRQKRIHLDNTLVTSFEEFPYSGTITIKVSPQDIKEVAGKSKKPHDKEKKDRVKPERELTEEEILFEDDVLIVVNKPSGVPTQATLDRTRDYLFHMVKRFLKKRDGAKAYAALHHRLDVGTSGVMVFCKQKHFNKEVSEIFSERKAHKVYHAWVSKKSPIEETEWTVENFLKKENIKRKTKVRSVTSDGDKAITHFKKLEETDNGYLIEATPKTGRTHQIRVHLSEAGNPIFGDRNYGERFQKCRLMLHAYKISFDHPKTGEPVEFVAQPPSDFSISDITEESLETSTEP